LNSKIQYTHKWQRKHRSNNTQNTEGFLYVQKCCYNITEPLVFKCTNHGYVQYKCVDHVLYLTASFTDKIYLVSNRNVSGLGLLACLEHSITSIEKHNDTYYPGTWIHTETTWNSTGTCPKFKLKVLPLTYNSKNLRYHK